MKLFVDASALVAILAREPEGGKFVDRISEADAIYSSLVHWEAANALCRIDRSMELEAASKEVAAFAGIYAIALVEIGEAETALAIEAAARYGKGRHRAKLNMGDCFAYACAKTNNAKLLYKGDDLSNTDLA